MPRVGNNDELLDLLRMAAAEKGGAGASAMGGLSPSTPAPRTPASPAPRSALSTGAAGNSLQGFFSTLTPHQACCETCGLAAIALQ